MARRVIWAPLALSSAPVRPSPRPSPEGRGGIRMMSDYPEDRGRVRVEAAGIEIEGVSIAGHESFYKVPALRALLEFGRAPEDTVGYSTIYLSHAHLDHAAGFAHHASRRKLGGLPPARVFAPKESASDLEAWVGACERLENVRYGVEDRKSTRLNSSHSS